MNVTPQTKRLASEILEYWSLFNRHDQSEWVGEDPTFSTQVLNQKEYNICETTLCAAGTAVFLSIPLNEFKQIASDDTYWSSAQWQEEGASLLGLTERESYKLFMEANETKAKELVATIAEGDKVAFDAISVYEDDDNEDFEDDED